MYTNHICVTVKSEKKFQSLFFHHMGPRDPTQVIMLSSKYISPLDQSCWSTSFFVLVCMCVCECGACVFVKHVCEWSVCKSMCM